MPFMRGIDRSRIRHTALAGPQGDATPDGHETRNVTARSTSADTPVRTVSYLHQKKPDYSGALGGYVRAKYYDDLLEENTKLVMRGLPPTAEYKRLDYLTEKLLAHDAEGVGEVAIAMEVEEVMDFLGAFERLLGPELMEVN